MAGKDEMRRPVSDAREKVDDVGGAGSGKGQTLDRKAGIGKDTADEGQGAVVGRRHRPALNERPKEGRRIGRVTSSVHDVDRLAGCAGRFSAWLA